MSYISRRTGKLALLVGIDRYPNFPRARQLQSCANDARLMAHVLQERFGFPKEDLVLLLNEAATREGILSGLASLRERVEEGDSVVFFYSGHGSKVVDREGDEPDGWDETIVPYDSGRAPYAFRDITDDEIYTWILDVNCVTPYVTVVADTCCSGTLTRNGAGPREKWIEPDTRSIAELPPSPVSTRFFRESKRHVGPSGFLPIGDRYVLFAACRDGESAKELPPITGEREPFGVFTFHLCRELLRAPPHTTYQDVLEPVRLAVAADAASQTPQLEGARNRVLFGKTTFPQQPYLTVRERAGSHVRLDGGNLKGVGVGSLWEIYLTGEGKVMAPKKSAGCVRVVRASALSAEAEVLKENVAIEVGARAVERAKGPNWMKLVVALANEVACSQEGKALSLRIDCSPLLRLVRDPASAEVTIIFRSMEPASATKELPVSESAEEWVAVGRDEELLLPPLRVPGSADGLTLALERLASYRALLKLKDDEFANPLRGCVEVHLLRRTRRGSFKRALANKVTGQIIYREGERLALHIVHRFEKSLYMHALNLGPDGSVSLIYPVPGANEALEPHRSLYIGVRPGDELEVRIPSVVEMLARASGQDPPEGREFIRVFATTHEADLSFLSQEGYGGEFEQRERCGTLTHALRRASLEDAATDEEGWTVATCSFITRGSRL